MSTYVASDGEYYTASEVVENVESGRWTAHLWETDTDRQLVETARGEVLLLVPATEVDFAPAFEHAT
ncbi:hypothetical protein [Haloarchaeobius baliensis]|uniref:hypothetical protein n=1 Tax=Haloarchaeobius baliensis TaxID=1670458 RepID=UPI003F883D2E